MSSKFFVAWSQTVSGGQIPTQSFLCDMRQERQFVDWYTNAATLDFARANPGQLYIIGDEPDQFCQTPEEYAEIFRGSALAILSVDPTARFSPAGFAEPNYYCTQSSIYDTSWDDAHSISYAEKFYFEYIRKYGTPPPVSEWRFHDFATTIPTGNVERWWNRVDKMATWSINHGAKMYLGSWGFLGWNQPTEIFQNQVQNLMVRLQADPRIAGAAWWSLGPWEDSTHPLMLDGILTPIGQTYASLPLPNNQGDIMTDAELARMTALEERLAKAEKIIGLQFVTERDTGSLAAELKPVNQLPTGQYPWILSDYQIRIGIAEIDRQLTELKVKIESLRTNKS